MDAELLFKRKFEVTTKAGMPIAFFMDLYRLPKGSEHEYKFSWIAFDPDDPTRRVLFDCHKPKGAHIHLDGDSGGEPIEPMDIDSAIALFFETVREHFGDFDLEE